METWAQLKPESNLWQYFPDGMVPITSSIPGYPAREGAPVCLMVDPEYLTDAQIQNLAWLLSTKWDGYMNFEQAKSYIENGLPLDIDHFEYFGLYDPREFYFDCDEDMGLPIMPQYDEANEDF
ncbi:MAG: hypothetical protein QNJ47_28185 [Nostocaceae cyanobacterium]|nr:hypothetical protein [Nostocaceae cyanobacterium]